MIHLKNLPTVPPSDFSKEHCLEKLEIFREKLFDLQDIFFADGRFSMLIVFQGMDTAGKDGTIRHVMTSMNPMGVNVKPFAKPTSEELSHDFLWRVYSHLPAKGMIQVFNRSYYEDILVPTVDKSISKDELSHRIFIINALEEHLRRNSTHVLKFFLHISQKEQLARIKERETLSRKAWKFSPEDVKAAELWEEYTEANSMTISKCNHPEWNIIPADKRWYRNYSVAKAMVDYLELMPLRYPGK